MANDHPDQSRREFLKQGALSGVAMVALPGLAPRLVPVGYLPEARAKAVIHIFLSGGLSHLDTFDPKPFAPVEVRGQFGTVKSKADGELFSNLVPRTARVADKITLIRSMTHTEAAHERGRHTMHTGYQPSPAITYPSMGTVVAHELGTQKSLPAYACVPAANDIYLGTGYLSAAYAPFSIGAEPNRRNFQVRDLSLPRGVGSKRLARRRKILAALDEEFTKIASSEAAQASSAFYEQAYDLIQSKHAREAFRISKHPGKLRNSYGRTNIGQRLLLARGMVEAGVRWVTVLDSGYDNHRDLVRGLRGRMQQLDRGYAALLQDLDASGLLDQTLVLLTTEFGRTPRINSNRGRDHWPRAFSVLLAGGGVKRGVVHGATLADGSEPARDPVKPADLSATVFQLLGIDPEKKILSPGGRPIDIVRGGQVLDQLLA
ncbi:MAG: DUF1501 domain-containing protein [Planctomycetota bacterium]